VIIFLPELLYFILFFYEFQTEKDKKVINFIMPYDRLVQVGRVAYIAYGPEKGKIACITNIIDQTRVLVDGPSSHVRRQPLNIKSLHLTKYVLKLLPGARSATVKKAWDATDVNKKWQETRWYKKLQAKHLRSQTTDFERFKIAKAKQAYNRVLNDEYNRLKKKSKAQLAKKAQKAKPRTFVSKSKRIANKFKIFAAPAAAAGKKK
jgi:large subunit ribosomal protein L14e